MNAPPESAPASYFVKLRPTLLSAIVHMMVLIALAVLTIDTVSDPGFELHLTSSDDLSAEELDEVELVDFDSGAIEAPAAATVEFESVAVESELLSSNVEAIEFSAPSEALTPDFGGSGEGMGEGVGQGKGKGRTSVFGLAGEGSKFAYVFDRSKSMTSTFRVYDNGVLVSELSPLMLAKAELVRSLRALGADDRFQIVFYNERPLVFGGLPELRRMFQATDEKKSEAEQFVIEVPGEGGTNHVESMKAALRLQPDIIFLITDGEEKDDPSESRTWSLIKSCQDDGVTVHLIHFGYEARPDSTLVTLATETGGQHTFIDIRALPDLSRGRAM